MENMSFEAGFGGGFGLVAVGTDFRADLSGFSDVSSGKFSGFDVSVGADGDSDGGFGVDSDGF